MRAERTGDGVAEAGLGATIGPIVALMGAAVVAVPIFRKLGLGSVLGYFAAGVLIGPSVLGLFTDPQAILHFSELGVVLFLFVIGLELRPQKLWSMRAQIFGLGLIQVLVCIGLLTLAGMVAFGLAPSAAFVGGSGFVMSSTAVIMSILQERGEIASVEGQKSVSILLFEDLMIVPLLAVVAWLSPATSGAVGLLGFAIALGALAGIILAGRYLLDPFFAQLARARTREVLTAGALLVVLGSALVMEAAGLSMAMGAFLAGVMLSGSSYRHQIETDVEPFRGLLMGLFFLAVGMSLDLAVVADSWRLLIAMLAVYVLVKWVGTYTVARIVGSTNAAAMKRAMLFAQGGEFAFVLYSAAASSSVIDARLSAIFSTVIILSMALTPVVLAVTARVAAARPKSTEGLEEPRDLKGQVLIVGFGRFGQVASQMLLSREVEVSIIDTDPDMIKAAQGFGFKIYYGDGTRLDILHHSGAAEAEVIMICVDDKAAATRIASLCIDQFPQSKVLVRSFDRRHSIELINAGVTYEIRETFDSALAMGAEGLRQLGSAETEAQESLEDIRQRDYQRLTEQIQGGMTAGRNHMYQPDPEPLSPVRKAATDASARAAS